MKGLCRVANSCKPGLIVGALLVACNGLCQISVLSKNTLDASWGALEVSIACGTIAALPCLTIFALSLWQGTGECISPTAIVNDLLFQKSPFAVTDSASSCQGWWTDAFVTAFNVRSRGSDLNFKEHMYGRIEMMTAQCPAWAHTCQSMCLNFSADQLRPTAFRMPKPKKRFSLLLYLPYHYQNDWD